MSFEAVGRRYARAVFELAKDGNNLPVVAREMGEFAATYADNGELSVVLGNPLVDQKTREAVLVEIGQRMGLGATTMSTLRLLVQRRRLEALPDIARELARLVDEDGNIVRAEVASAAPLGEAYVAKLRAELEKATGQKVVVVVRHDPSLIAGVVTKIGDRVIDGSLRARLDNFRDTLLRS